MNVKIVQKDEMKKWNERKNIKSGEKIIQKKIVNQSHLKVLTTRNGLLVASVKNLLLNYIT